MGAMTISAAVADSETGASASGASVAMALGGGTLTVGYSNQDLIADAAEGTGGYSFGGQQTNAVTTTTTLVTNNADDLTTTVSQL